MIISTFFFLSATNVGVPFISFATIIGTPLGIASASFAFFFSLTTRIIKKLLSLIRNKKKKYDKTLILAKRRLNIIENLVSKELIEMEISHKELITILIENNK